MAKEISKKQNAEVATLDEGLFSGMDTGFEGTSTETFKTPFMKILQAMSPELKPRDPEFVEGAKMGMFCNSATKELHEELNVVILKVEHSLVTWKPGRGGFAGRVNKADEKMVVVDQLGLQKWDVDRNEVVDTIEFFCMNADDPSDIFILSLSKASFKHAKSFATRLRMLKSDGRLVNVSWAGVWNITLIEEKNDKGAWYTIGNTPRFVRFISKEERDNFVLPAKDMLKSAMVDYHVIESTVEDEEENKY